MMLRSCGGWACVAAPQASEAVTLSGGSDRTRYLFSGNYMKQDGIQIGSDFERYGVRFNLDADVSPRFRMGTSLSLTTVTRNAPRVENGSVGAGANGILAAMQFDPSLPPRDAKVLYAATYQRLRKAIGFNGGGPGSATVPADPEQRARASRTLWLCVAPRGH